MAGTICFHIMYSCFTLLCTLRKDRGTKIVGMAGISWESFVGVPLAAKKKGNM